MQSISRGPPARVAALRVALLVGPTIFWFKEVAGRRPGVSSAHRRPHHNGQTAIRLSAPCDGPDEPRQCVEMLDEQEIRYWGWQKVDNHNNELSQLKKFGDRTFE